MSLKFCANLGFMFLENNSNVLERYRLASIAGFKGIEGPFPTGFLLDDIKNVQTETGLTQVLLNINLGSVPKGQFGCAAFPNVENEFKQNFNTTLEYAKALNCKKIHIMSGKLDAVPTEENHNAYLNNLRYASEQLEGTDIIAVIEPINSYSVPGYYLNSYERALNVITTINSPKIKLMLDVFHLQLIRGNITNAIKDFAEHIGHVQIAQSPNRHEPSYEGEINFPYVLKQLIENGYTDWIGCEYIPKSGSAQSLNWINEFGYSL